MKTSPQDVRQQQFKLKFRGFDIEEVDNYLELIAVELEELNKENDSSMVFIKGNAKNAIYLSLNGREIFIEKDGAFTEPIALLPGFGVVTLTAQDKFGKTAEKKFEIVYEESAGSVALGNPNINTN